MSNDRIGLADEIERLRTEVFQTLPGSSTADGARDALARFVIDNSKQILAALRQTQAPDREAGERMRGKSKTHRLPDENAPRHSWKFVKHIAAKARAEALKEAADLARTQALIANTSTHAHLLPVEHVADALQKLANEAIRALPSAQEGKPSC